MEEYLCLRDAQDVVKLRMQATITTPAPQLIIYMLIASHAVRKETERRVLEGL